jgi:hypothetical protein
MGGLGIDLISNGVGGRLPDEGIAKEALMTAIRKQVTVPEDHKIHLDLDVPAEIPAGEVELIVTITPPGKTRQDLINAIKGLREVAKRGDLAKAIPDPSAWQREIREDRPLPGRE